MILPRYRIPIAYQHVLAKHAKAAAPEWLRSIADFDGLEISPCCVFGFANGEDLVEPCEPDAADFWTVYGHRREGGVTAFEDFPDHAAAQRFARLLLHAHQHLRHYALSDEYADWQGGVS